MSIKKLTPTMAENIDKSRLQNILAKKYDEAQDEYLDQGVLEKITQELKSPGDRYISQEEIGRGGMKKILKVKDRLTDRWLAMATAISDSDPGQQEQFLREARITACLQHPNIMPVHEIGIDENGQAYFTMKLVEGDNLGQIIKKSVDEEEVDLHRHIDIFLKTCDAIAYAHDRGIVHLDLKPDNVQVGPHGEVLVCDWGLAKIIYHECEEDILFKNDLDNADLELTLNNRGTPGYMAPEQFDKNVPLSKLTDIYCLGCILYTILTFKKPVDESKLDEIVTKTVSGDIIKPSWRAKDRNLPASLEAICLKAMSTESSERYQNVDEIIDEINSYQRGFSSEAENATFLTEAGLLYKRNKVLMNTIGVFLIILFFSFSTFVYKLSGSRHQAITAEIRTRVAFEKLQEENKLREDAEAAAFKRWMIQARNNFSNALFAKALGDLESALRYQPAAKEALRYKAEAALGNMNIPLFLESVAKMETVHKNLARAAGALSGKEELDAEEYFEVQHLFYIKSYHTAAEAVLKKCLLNCPKEKRGKLIKLILLSRNEGLKESDIQIDFNKRLLTVHSKFLKEVPFLSGSGIHHIDLSGSGISNTKFLKDMKVVSLNVSKAQLDLMGVNELNGIKYVDFSYTAVKNMPRTIGHAIELNISGCDIEDYSRLLILKQIKKLTISENQVPQEILKELNCKVSYK